MKKLSFIFAAFIALFSVFVPTKAIALEDEPRLYISKTGEMWDDYVNMMNIIFPGGKISGLYYHKLYAKYDSNVGGFVIVDKVASHISYSKKVEEASFGLCFSYNPEYKSGREFGKKNYSLWSQLRVGDVLYPHGIDFTAKEIKTKGVLSKGTLESDAYFTVVFAKREKEPTAYNGKTIVALGDSVTCNGGWTETVGDLVGCNVINSGVSADRATEALLRFDSDVKAYSPDVVLVMLGINDCVQYYYSDKTILSFKNELIQIYQKCIDIGAKVVFITPNQIKVESLNYDRYKNYGGLPACYPKFIDTVKEVAEETGAYLVDIYSLFDESLLCDSVHPNKEGYDIISSEISKCLIAYADRICGDSLEGFVSTGEGKFEIKNEVLLVEECTVSDLKKYFCNEIKVYKNDIELDENDFISSSCFACWVDSKGVERDRLSVFVTK